MDDPRAALERIAAALERLAPPVPAATDWSANPAYLWDGISGRPVAGATAEEFDRLRGIDEQKDRVRANFERLAQGAAAHDTLLWGARGMGKSALVRAAVAKVQQQSGQHTIALVGLLPGTLETITTLIDQLAPLERGFVLFVDDLGFAEGDARAALALRSLLDGSLPIRPANVRIAVTSNRRAIVRSEVPDPQALHERDERDDGLALADRFGLTLGFHPCDRPTYLAILRAYTDPLGLDIDEEEALAYAIERGNRSGRTAMQYACELAGRAGLPLS